VVATAPRRATYGDLLAVPSHLVAEIINGELRTQPRPGGPHAAAASILGMVLGNPFHRGSGGPGGWVILDEPELHLDQDVLVPDLAGWRRERMPVVPDAAAFDLAPDWIAEVLSPSTEAIDRTEKLPIYARSGIEYVWLLNPRLQTLEAFSIDGDGYRLLGAWRGEVTVRLPPFEAVEMELGGLWAR
jgi:Uma2 family endonuclease